MRCEDKYQLQYVLIVFCLLFVLIIIPIEVLKKTTMIHCVVNTSKALIDYVWIDLKNETHV